MGASGTGGPCGRGPDDVGGGHHAGAVGLSESATGEARPAAARREPHGVAGMPPMGAGGSGHRAVAAMPPA